MEVIIACQSQPCVTRVVANGSRAGVAGMIR